MANGAICDQEIAQLNENILNEFANFNYDYGWSKSSGGSNATILNDVTGKHSYSGKGSVGITFVSTGQVEFNTGDTTMNIKIERSGIYVLSYAFYKSDSVSEINFIVEVRVNGILLPQNTIQQTLNTDNGFINGNWNTFFQSLNLDYEDVVSFNFKTQSNTPGSILYFDRMKLELAKTVNIPSIYTEAPLDVFEHIQSIEVPEIASGESQIIVVSFPGANKKYKYFISMEYPEELITFGLIINNPIVSDTNLVKFSIFNPTPSPITLTADSIYKFKILR